MKKLIITALILLMANAYAQDIEYVSSALYSGQYNSIYVAGSYAYCGAHRSFQILSIDDPENPSFIGGYPLEGRVRDVAVSGDYAFLAEQINSYPYGNRTILRSFDISSPSHPSQLDSLNMGNGGSSIALFGEYLFLSHYYQGLYVIDISNPSSPTL